MVIPLSPLSADNAAIRFFSRIHCYTPISISMKRGGDIRKNNLISVTTGTSGEQWAYSRKDYHMNLKAEILARQQDFAILCHGKTKGIRNSKRNPKS
jgi:hypothetical protein